MPLRSRALAAGFAALIVLFSASALAQQDRDASPNPTAQSVQEQQLLQELRRIEGRVTIPDSRAGVLEQPQGREYQAFHERVLPWLGAIVIVAVIPIVQSYILWKRTGSVPEDRHVLLEGTEPAAYANCAAPELRILISNRGRAGLFPGVVIGGKGRWGPSGSLETGESATQRLRLPAGRWRLSMQYFSPFDLTLTGPGLRQPLPAALDGQRPNTISLANQGQFWPAGEIHSSGEPVRFTVKAAKPSTLQRLSGYSGKANLGELVAVPAKPHRIVPLSKACGGWIDWYESEEVP